jgi:CHASE2 domain-containing sensor protein
MWARAREALKKLGWIGIGKAVLAIVLAMVATYVVSPSGRLLGLEHWLLNQVSFRPAVQAGAQSPIRIVNIYRHDFEGHSTLKPEQLHAVIDAIARSKPKIIAVDIDTSDHVYRENIERGHFKVDPSWPLIIWEHDISTESERKEEIYPLDVLGGYAQAFNKHSGIPQLLDDPEDHVTRFYTRCVKTNSGLLPSFV